MKITNTDIIEVICWVRRQREKALVDNDSESSYNLDRVLKVISKLTGGIYDKNSY